MIPKLVSNRFGRWQPATKEQRRMFDDYDPAVDEDDSTAFNDPMWPNDMDEEDFEDD